MQTLLGCEVSSPGLLHAISRSHPQRYCCRKIYSTLPQYVPLLRRKNKNIHYSTALRGLDVSKGDIYTESETKRWSGNGTVQVPTVIIGEPMDAATKLKFNVWTRETD